MFLISERLPARTMAPFPLMSAVPRVCAKSHEINYNRGSSGNNDTMHNDLHSDCIIKLRAVIWKMIIIMVILVAYNWTKKKLKWYCSNINDVTGKIWMLNMHDNRVIFLPEWLFQNQIDGKSYKFCYQVFLLL